MQVVRAPEQVPAIARVVHVGLIEGTSFSSSVEAELEPPQLEQIVTEATAYTKALNALHLVRHRPPASRGRQHESAPDGQLAPLPKCLVDGYLVTRHHRVTDCTKAV